MRMPSGGARVSSGPPPDPNSLRTAKLIDKDGWLNLPAGGYDGPVPDWPLMPDLELVGKLEVAEGKVARLEGDLDEAPASGRAAVLRRLDEAKEKAAVLTVQVREQRRLEETVWAEAWRSPQALAWASRVGWYRDVAQYVRHKVLAEMGSMDDAKEARQWSDRLGLNPSALLRNRWRIVASEEPRAAAAAKPSAVKPKSSARARFQSISGGK